MDSAAMAMMATIDAATSAMVKPRSFERGSAERASAPFCGRRISGGSIGSPFTFVQLIFVERRTRRRKVSRAGKGTAHQTGNIVVLPLVRVFDVDAGLD